ncbi:MAG TPA: hypothetical protein RMH99_02935 [Sandaracinaceae bacterium LLY-WYZ-13_1]|nr:hypothetical protein [Sandaracinaceae bacterium LLY-WYZ-13_1]
MSRKPSWIDDPKLARQLARFTWLVLVGAGVLLTRFPLAPSWERLALAGVIAAVVVMNAPVAVGLYRSRDEAETAPFRAVALAFGLRVLATAAVVWWVSSA